MAEQPVCIHCGAAVWWGMPQPTDPCYECGQPIAGDREKETTAHEMEALVMVLAEMELRGYLTWRLNENNTLNVEFTELGQTILREADASWEDTAKGRAEGIATLRELLGMPGYSGNVAEWIKRHGSLAR